MVQFFIRFCMALFKLTVSAIGGTVPIDVDIESVSLSVFSFGVSLILVATFRRDRPDPNLVIFGKTKEKAKLT